MIDELLGRAPGDAAVAELPAIGLGQQLGLVQPAVQLPGRQGLDDGLELLAAGNAVVDGDAEPGGQGELLLHGIRAVDVVFKLHVVAVGPGFLD